MAMRRTILSFLVLALIGCEQQAVQSKQPVEIRTVDNSPMKSIPVEPLPQLAEEATVLRPQAPSPSPSRRPNASPTPADSAEARPQMPFAPLIAMDPVDGSKVSIRVETPTTEYKNRLYYFGSEANRKAFVAEPEKYLKGQLARY